MGWATPCSSGAIQHIGGVSVQEYLGTALGIEHCAFWDGLWCGIDWRRHLMVVVVVVISWSKPRCSIWRGIAEFFQNIQHGDAVSFDLDAEVPAGVYRPNIP